MIIIKKEISHNKQQQEGPKIVCSVCLNEVKGEYGSIDSRYYCKIHYIEEFKKQRLSKSADKVIPPIRGAGTFSPSRIANRRLNFEEIRARFSPNSSNGMVVVTEEKEEKEKDKKRSKSVIVKGKSKFRDRVKCIVCHKTVYSIELITVGEDSFHRTCFKCGCCGKTLVVGEGGVLDGKYLCKIHYKQLSKAGLDDLVEKKNGNSL